MIFSRTFIVSNINSYVFNSFLFLYMVLENVLISFFYM